MTGPAWLKTPITALFTLDALLVCGVAAAESLSDFQKAKKAMEDGDGCESIPYYSLRSTCLSQQALVHPWCDGGHGPVTCEKGVNVALNTKLTQLEKTKDTLTRELDGLKRALASADPSDKPARQRELDQKQDELDSVNDQIAQGEQDLAAHRSDAEAAIKAINGCLDARRAVMNVFAAAKDKVAGERDPDVVPIARELRDAYEESKRGHEMAITAKENALSTCVAEAR